MHAKDPVCLAVRSTLCIALAAPLSLAAAPGLQDPSFGEDGTVSLAFPGDRPITQPFPSFQSIVLEPDGSMLVGATVLEASGRSVMGLLRLHATGVLDSDYAASGAAIVAFELNSTLADARRTSDGRVVLAGSVVTDADVDMAVARLNPDGSLDSTFGSGGQTTVGFDLGGDNVDYGTVASVFADGRVQLAGAATTVDGLVMAVARLTAAGMPDLTFDFDGKRTINFGTATDRHLALDMVVLADGERSIVAGFAVLAGNAEFALARLLGNGQFDPDFGTGGRAIIALDIGGNLQDALATVTELPDGKLLACGHVRVDASTNEDFACVRLHPNGDLDQDFTTIPIDFDNADDRDNLWAVQIDAKGRILLAGSTGASSDTADFALARLHPDGTLDTGFGNAGRMTYDSVGAGGVPNEATGLAIDADGNVLLAGAASIGSSDPAFHLQVTRALGDTVFGNGFEVQVP